MLVPESKRGRCAQCGYLLTGLPAEGRCPECGNGYSPGTIILWGESGEWRRTSLRLEIALLAMWSVGVSFIVVLLRFEPPTVVFLALLVVQALRVWRRARGYQVLLSPEGYAARRGFGEVVFHPWHKDHEIDLRKFGRNVYLFTILYHSVSVILQIRCTDEQAKELREAIQTIAHHRVFLEK